MSRVRFDETYSKLCELCLEAEADPDRDDGLCDVCGEVSDKYNEGTQFIDINPAGETGGT